MRNNPTNLLDPTGECVFGLPCPKPILTGVVLTGDIVAIGFTGSSAVITDLATAVGCLAPGVGCVAGYLLGYGATTPLRLVGNIASATSALVSCIGTAADKESVKNCAFSLSTAIAGGLVREPNVGTALDIYQFCRDFGKCGP